MGRVLLILSLITYVLYKLGFFRGLSQGLKNPSQAQNRRPPNANVNVDGVAPKDKKRTNFKGGEYIDYEEIK